MCSAACARWSLSGDRSTSFWMRRVWGRVGGAAGEGIRREGEADQVHATGKSEMGYAFLGLIETGRFRDCASTEEVVTQYRHCESEILPGPQKTMRWGVKDGTRDAEGRPCTMISRWRMR